MSDHDFHEAIKPAKRKYETSGTSTSETECTGGGTKKSLRLPHKKSVQLDQSSYPELKTEPFGQGKVLALYYRKRHKKAYYEEKLYPTYVKLSRSNGIPFILKTDTTPRIFGHHHLLSFKTLNLTDCQERRYDLFKEYSQKFLGTLKFESGKWKIRDPDRYSEIKRECVEMENEMNEECNFTSGFFDCLVRAYQENNFYNSHGRAVLCFLIMCCKQILCLTKKANPNFVHNLGGGSSMSGGITKVLQKFVYGSPPEDEEENIESLMTDGIRKDIVADMVVIGGMKEIGDKGRCYLYGEVENGDSRKEDLQFKLWHQLLGGLIDSDVVYGIAADAVSFKIMEMRIVHERKRLCVRYHDMNVQDDLNYYDVNFFMEFVHFLLHVIHENHEG